jgi:amino acid transporter
MPIPPSGPDLTPGNDTRGGVSRFRVERSRAPILRIGPNHFEATEFAERRRGWTGIYLQVRDTVLGATLASNRIDGERLSKVKALAVLSSDAISSVAYAPQEILFVLVLAGTGAIKWSLPIAAAITALLVIVVASYRQTVRAYPNGGGAYIVAHANIGIGAGLIAAAALLTDYVLTVSVSVASGIDALASLNEGIRPFAAPLAIGIVCLVALINLRGVGESGTIFSIPTYAFIVLLTGAIVVAMVKIVFGGHNPLVAGTPRETQVASESLTLLLILKAFAGGCTAMTGVEAISNGVQVFKVPSANNARVTLLWMGAILAFLFMGSTLLAHYYGFVPHENNTILSQLGAEGFGDGSILFSLLNIMTAGILILAANTSFADFPRLSAILARDGYMPRIFHQRGNRLVFSFGIIVLAVLASLLLVAFNATTTRLIPLYALGVFLSFTLSQSGMVRHWLKGKDPGWKSSAVVNGLGATATGVVFLVIIEAKFSQGAWFVVILIPMLASGFWTIGRFYRRLERLLYVAPATQYDLRARGQSRVPTIVPVNKIDLASVVTLQEACERSSDVTAVHVIVDPDDPSDVSDRWGIHFPEIPMVVIDSPYRTIADPLAAYIDARLGESPHEVIVMVPSLAVGHWYQGLLVNLSMKRLSKLLEHRRHVEVIKYVVNPKAPFPDSYEA